MLEGKKIAVLGVGMVGKALVSGLVRSHKVAPEMIVGSTAHEESARAAREKLGIEVILDNRELVQGKNIVILAVKPKTVPKVLVEIKGALSTDQLLISVAAAVRTKSIEEALGKPVPVVRAMPNMPCLVGQGMTVLCPGRFADRGHLALAREVFSAVGRVAVVDDEDLMDPVTALSGAGPAYAYIIVEALAEGGVKMGLPRELATELAAQTLLGSAAMVLETGEHPALLKDMVTTPAGVTVDGIMALEEGGIRVDLIKAVMAATERARILNR
jgi:pyrroline-5-carboxylate reductase